MLEITFLSSVKASNAGLFVSRGKGIHPARVLNSYELIYVVQGQLTLKEEEKIFHLTAGESLILYPHRQHTGIDVFHPDLKFYWVHFTLPQLGNSSVNEICRAPQHTQVSNPEQLVNLFRMFINEQENANRQNSLDLFLLLILQDLTESESELSHEKARNSALAFQAKNLIRTQFQATLSASLIAARLHCNPDYLGRLYQQTFKHTLTAAIHAQRIQHATNLILEEKLTIQQIAQQSGFEDIGYFRRIFKKETGLSPLVYRKFYSKDHVNTR